jgi:hypothetical protein
VARFLLSSLSKGTNDANKKKYSGKISGHEKVGDVDVEFRRG